MKKVLSIVLSLVMVLCMMPVMAFAGTDEAVGASFSDADSITHSEAVYSLAALNIINGYTDGTYKPAKTVTRAEMCKMIATLYNGGTEPVLSTTTTSYTDTKGHWAAGYIEYCTSLGIVAGVGGGRFSPDATVTAEQAAKMLLIAQGYNADVEGLVGASWAGNTNVLANQNDYYKELADISTGAGLVREHAAQMIYNGLDAKVIKKSNSVNQATGEVITIYEPSEQSVANKYLSLEEVSGELTKIDYNKKDSVYKYTVGAKEYESAVNYIALFGQNVKVLYKTEKGKTVVYGMYADESSVLYEGVWGDVDSSTLNATKKTVKIDGTEYKLDSSSIPTPVAVAYEKVDTPSAVAAYSEIKVVDNDNDGDIDKIVYTPVAVNKITFVGKTQFTLENGGTKTIEDEITYDGMAKNDFVAVTYDVKSDKDVYTKLEMLKDVKVTSTKGDTATINGTAYKNTIDGAKVVAGAKYGTVAILNGYIVKTDVVTTEGDVTKYAVITGLKTVEDYDTTYKAKLLMSSGEEVEVTAKSIDGLKVGQLVNFEVNDDVYTLTDSVNNGFDKATYSADFIAETKDTSAKMTFKQPSESAGTYGIADDAVVFIKNVITKNNGETEDVYSVIKGSELAKKSSATVVKAYADENKSTGFTNVVLAYVSQANADKTTYAYVTDDPVKNVDDKNVTTYEISLSTGTFTTTNNLSVSSDIKKGAIVSYTVNADNKISAIATTGTKDAVTAYDGKNIKLNTAAATYQFTDDATIIYIDSSAKKVAEGGNITLADKNAESHYVNNVIYTLKDGKVDLLVVDVNNEMK